MIKFPNDILNYSFDELCRKLEVNMRYSDETKFKFLKYSLEKEIEPEIKSIFNKSWFDGQYSLLVAGELANEYQDKCLKNIKTIYRQYLFSKSIKKIENTPNYFAKLAKRIGF